MRIFVVQAACAGKHANFSLACANAKLNVSLTTERYRAYQTECKLGKIHLGLCTTRMAISMNIVCAFTSSLFNEKARALSLISDDAAIKIHHLEWNVSVLKNLIQKEKVRYALANGHTNVF